MKLRLSSLLLLLTGVISSVLCGENPVRQSAVFTASNQYVESAGSEPSHTVYDTLSLKRPSTSGEYGQGKQLSEPSGNSFGFTSSADSSGSYSNSVRIFPVPKNMRVSMTWKI